MGLDGFRSLVGRDIGKMISLKILPRVDVCGRRLQWHSTYIQTTLKYKICETFAL